MPCKSGLEDMTPIDYKTLYEDSHERYLEEIEKLKYEQSLSEIEHIAFHSFMTVFLCKAMELIETNNLMQHTYEDMEWWWREHQIRDKNNDRSKTNPEVLEKRLKKIYSKYKIK